MVLEVQKDTGKLTVTGTFWLWLDDVNMICHSFLFSHLPQGQIKQFIYENTFTSISPLPVLVTIE